MAMQEHNLLDNSNAALKRELDAFFLDTEQLVQDDYFNHLDEEEDIDQLSFEQCYVNYKSPVVLRNSAKDWPASQKWDFDYLADTYGETPVVKNLYNIAGTQQTTLKAFIAELTNKTSDIPQYLQEWWFQEGCPKMSHDVIVPPHFENDENKRVLGFDNMTLWIGQKGAHTPLHQDTVHANIWTAQIRGRKEWVLISPEAHLKMGANGKPDYDRFFIENQHHILRVVLEPGDILYVPFKWWHRARTLENAISLNTFYVTSDILQDYMKDVLSIPMALGVNKELLCEKDPMRHQICQRRTEILAKMLKFNPNNILNVDTTGEAVSGIYA